MANADCGSYGASQATTHIEWKTSNKVGSGIAVGKGASSVSCFLQEDIYEQTQGKLTSQVVCFDCMIFGDDGKPVCEDMCTYTYDATFSVYKGTQTVVGKKLRLVPFSINASADVKSFYRVVNGQNHLIVQVSNVFSYLIGGQNADNLNDITYTVVCMPPFAFTMAVSLTPEPSASDWKYCFGGWYGNGPCHDCFSQPCNYQTIGGFNYYWNSRRVDAPFARSPYPGRSNPGPYEWDLGPINVQPNAILYISAALTTGSANCESQRKYSTGRTMLGITPPPLKVCPPEIIEATQERDICESCAYHSFTIGPNDLIDQPSGRLVIDYVWKGQLPNVDWSKAETATYPIYKNQQMEVDLPCLIGSSHYAYRMKIVLDTDFVAESDYVYGEFDTLFIPPANMTVPTISVEECTDIDSGNLVPPFEEIVSYGG